MTPPAEMETVEEHLEAENFGQEEEAKRAEGSPAIAVSLQLAIGFTT